jgi:hypothetical protein
MHDILRPDGPLPLVAYHPLNCRHSRLPHCQGLNLKVAFLIAKVRVAFLIAKVKNRLPHCQG